MSREITARFRHFIPIIPMDEALLRAVIRDATERIRGLAYLQKVEGKRPDIAVLDINDLGKHDTYWKSSPDLRQVLENGQRPVYAAIKKSFLRGLKFVPCGLAYRVLTREQAPLSGLVLLGSRTQFTEYETSILSDPTVYLGHFMQILAANYGFFRVEYLLEVGADDRALRLAQWLIDRDYSPKQVYNNLGSALAERGFNEDAVKAYRVAIARDPLYRSALLNLSSVEKSLGNEDGASRPRKRALRLSRKHHD